SRESELHILVNNAGAAWGAKIDEYPASGFDKVLNLNVKGVFELTKRFLPLLEKAATPEDPARVINIGSVDGIRVPVLENSACSVCVIASGWGVPISRNNPAASLKSSPGRSLVSPEATMMRASNRVA